MSEITIGLSIFITAFALSFRLAPVMARRAQAAGQLDLPGGRKQQKEAVPYGGGTALAAALVLTIILGLGCALILADQIPALRLHLDGLRRRSLDIVLILFGAAVMWVMGRRDDRRPLTARYRLLLQFCAALPIASSSLRLTLFIDEPGIQVALTLVWLVFITNAWNFIDNMDGLLPGTALIAAAGFSALAIVSGQLFVAAFALALAGAVAGVLPHNRRPARLYLGDEGSMFLGFLFGSLAMVSSYRSAEQSATFLPFVVPLAVLVVPVLDALVAISGRLLRGVSPLTAGRDHLSHRLVAGGFSPRASVRLLHGLGAAGSALALFFHRHIFAGLVFFLVFLLLAMIRTGLALGNRRCE